MDEIDGLLQAKYQLTIDKIEFEDLEELQESSPVVMRVNRRDTMTRRKLVSEFPLWIEGKTYMVTATYDFRVKALKVVVTLDGKEEFNLKRTRLQDLVGA